MSVITYSDDPAADWDAYCEAQEEETKAFIESTPKCTCCGRHVAEVDDYYYKINSDVILCEECLRKTMRCVS